ncbi:MAG: sigma-70 family RNA polymerase sigma factor [Planctomycetota bacterium]
MEQTRTTAVDPTRQPRAPQTRMQMARAASELSEACLSDGELLDAWVHDRHAPALSALVDRYSPIVLSVCVRRSRHRCDADDAFQNTFLTLAHRAYQIKNPARLPGWLHQVAIRCADAINRSRSKTKPLETEPMVETEEVLERIAYRHDASILDEELAKLPETYRSVILMQFYDETSIQKLADHFQTSIGVIRGRLHRGKRQLARQLRQRGVIPVIAMSAALVTRASHADAAELVRDVGALVDQPTPPVPVPPPDLPPLLSLSTSVMTTAKVTAAIGVLIAAAAFLTAPTGEATDNGEFLTMQVAASPQNERGTEPSRYSVLTEASSSTSEELPESDSAFSVPRNVVGPDLQGGQPASDGPATRVAKELTAMLDENQDFRIQTRVEDLASDLQHHLNMPVQLDRKALSIAQVEFGEIIEQEVAGLPLRSALHQMLTPLRLKAVVRDHGLVIIPDYEELVRDGIATTRWVSLDEAWVAKAESVLSREVEFAFAGAPLDEALEMIAEQVDFPILLDRVAVEAVGLTEDFPVELRLTGVRLGDFLTVMLKPLDLQCHMVNNNLLVTTEEAAVEQLATRIYFLEGFGIDKEGESDAILALAEAIQATVSPEKWETMGGNCTIALVSGHRPNFVITATYRMHQGIDRLLTALRGTAAATAADAFQNGKPSPSETGANGRSNDPATEAKPKRQRIKEQPAVPASSDPFGGPTSPRDPFASDPFAN